MNAELNTIMTRLDEVQSLFDETCRTNATLAATAIDELRTTLAEAVSTITKCLKKIKDDAHKGILANRKFLTGYCDDMFNRATHDRKTTEELLTKRMEDFAATAATRRKNLEDSFTTELAALVKKLSDLKITD